MKNGRYIADDGIEEWFKNGRCHRLDGPALFYPDNGSEYWFKEGVWHREDGPAVCGGDAMAKRTHVWWVEGIRSNRYLVFLIALSKSLDLSEFWK